MYKVRKWCTVTARQNRESVPQMQLLFRKFILNIFLNIFLKKCLSFHSDSSTVSNGFRLEWFVEGCGGVLTHPQGELLSPNFPKKYSHEVTCIWEINVDFGNLIEVTVNEIDLESSNKCDFDVLNFSNDRNFTNHIAGFCEAQDISKVVTSESHRLFVKFNSDETNNGRGFNATYKSVLASCGGKMYGSSGTISSKGYPSQNYENNHTCEWNIKTDPSHSIKFQLLDFDLESSENCSKDYLEIYDPVFKNILWKGCGNPILNQTVFNSKRNELNIILHSDDSINAKGFRANFTDSCGARILVNDSGSVSFRRSMEDYNCTWTFISADPTKKVTITFTYAKIFIEGEDGCFSKILVFDGDSDSGSLKKSFCGSKTPPAITSNGNALTVKLNTTSMSLANEFDVHYSVLDNG